MPCALSKTKLFGLQINIADMASAVDAIATSKNPHRAHIVSTVNVDHLVKLEKNDRLKQMYASADFIFADGMPIVWCSRLFGSPLPGRVTGADLFKEICAHAQLTGKSIFVLGGNPGEESMLYAKYKHRYPQLDITLHCPSMNFDPEGREALVVCDAIREKKPDFIFICLGFPKQELWAWKHAARLPNSTILCVGAAQLFALGLQKRAPLWMQKAGLEWLWRLISDPLRLWRRYLVDDIGFIKIMIKEWRSRKNEH